MEATPLVSKSLVLFKEGCFKMDIDSKLICVSFSSGHTLLLLSWSPFNPWYTPQCVMGSLTDVHPHPTPKALGFYK